MTGRPWRSAKVPWLVLLGTWLLAAPVSGGGLREFTDGWLAGGDDLHRLLAGHRRTVGWRWEAGRARLYGLEELPQYHLAIERADVRGGLVLRWQQMGADLFREDRWRLRLRGPWRLPVSIEGGLDRLRVPGQPDRSQAALALLLAVETGSGPRLEFWAHLAPAAEWNGDREPRPAARGVFRQAGGLGTLLVERDGTGGLSLQGEAVGRLGAGGAAGLRIEAATGTLVLVTAWARGALLLRTSHAVHPRLGITHRWCLAWAFPAKAGP